MTDKKFNLKDKPEDRQEYIKAKKRKYGENWKDYVSSGDPGKWKQKPNIKPKERAQKGLGAALRGGGRAFNKGGKV